MPVDPAIRRSTILVMAKEPVAGRVKTRLCPPCTPAEAAAIATAALADTLEAVTAAGAGRVLLALDGAPGPWIPRGVEVVAQCGDGFADRLANAWDDAGGPTVQVGMDTPQLTPELLDDALRSLHRPGVGSVLGPADDGGWWLLGLHAPDRRVFDDITMSRSDTGAHQLTRLHELELSPTLVGRLCDIDTFADAQRVAATIPASATAEAVAAVGRGATGGSGPSDEEQRAPV